jgi:hypothetical protein
MCAFARKNVWVNAMANELQLPGLEIQAETIVFTPTREAGLARLSQFVMRTGRHYASQRNFDFGLERRNNVSALSPWIRHRLITEEEVLRTTLACHAPSTAEKFIQEVLWRTYFKGWLEQHPSVWATFQDDLRNTLVELERDNSLNSRFNEAIEGRTAIDCFDHWVRELIETGYLHNHARMWFASIWIFTLRLPWQLGADFFLRHLLDGDPASNTLSWRWVAGLHTKGKTYLARRENIARYTDGRFDPHGLSQVAVPLVEVAEHARRPIAQADQMPKGAFLLLVTEEDCRIDELLLRAPAVVIGLMTIGQRSPLPVGEHARSFAGGAVTDALVRNGDTRAYLLSADEDWTAAVISAACDANVSSIVTGNATTGPVASVLKKLGSTFEGAGIRIHQIRRDYDEVAWPHATRGFFALKQKIPQILGELNSLTSDAPIKPTYLD